MRELTALYGTSGVIRLFGETIASRILSKLRRSRSASKFYSIEQAARAYGIAYKKIGNPNAQEFVESVRQRAAELLVSVACPYIFKQNLLSLPPRGCVNIHHASLPRYRGMMPTFWQIFHGEKTVGVTVHYMGANVDEGAALLQEQLEIEPGESLNRLIRRSKRHGAHCMGRALRQLESGMPISIPLDSSKGSYFSFPKIAEIREFKRRGFRTI